jgi:hypothetical protein
MELVSVVNSSRVTYRDASQPEEALEVARDGQEDCHHSGQHPAVLSRLCMR